MMMSATPTNNNKKLSRSNNVFAFEDDEAKSTDKKFIFVKSTST
jgi:hypothetical protein